MKATAESLDALLPQTQCRECGYNGCKPYAEALAGGEAPIDRCPPGGVHTLHRLGEALGIDSLPYEAAMREKTREPSVARIREAECIGCTKCLKACPVDAIIGVGKHMHAVLAHECTGCGLCVEPCPVDCIEMLPLPEALFSPEKARERVRARAKREDAARVKPVSVPVSEKSQQQSYILEALARVRQKQSPKSQDAYGREDPPADF